MEKILDLARTVNGEPVEAHNGNDLDVLNLVSAQEFKSQESCLNLASVQPSVSRLEVNSPRSNHQHGRLSWGPFHVFNQATAPIIQLLSPLPCSVSLRLLMFDLYQFFPRSIAAGSEYQTYARRIEFMFVHTRFEG
jgi:hypothetical protein